MGRYGVRRIQPLPLLVLMGCVGLLSGCGLFKSHTALPPCHESDGDVAYTQDGTQRKDGLFLTWQCYERMQQDIKACYDAAK